MCVYMIRCEVILRLVKMASSWWNHTLGLLVLKGGTRRFMEFRWPEVLFGFHIILVIYYTVVESWCWWWEMCVFKSCVELLSLCLLKTHAEKGKLFVSVCPRQILMSHGLLCNTRNISIRLKWLISSCWMWAYGAQQLLQILVMFLLSLTCENDVVHISICSAELMLPDYFVHKSLKAGYSTRDSKWNSAKLIVYH